MINNGLPLAHSLRNKCHLPSMHLPPETGRESMCVSSHVVGCRNDGIGSVLRMIKTKAKCVGSFGLWERCS